MLGAFQTSLHLTHQPAPVGIISLYHCVLPAGRQTLVSQNPIHLIIVKKSLLKSNLITLLLHLKPPGSPSHALRMAPSAQAVLAPSSATRSLSSGLSGLFTAPPSCQVSSHRLTCPIWGSLFLVFPLPGILPQIPARFVLYSLMSVSKAPI